METRPSNFPWWRVLAIIAIAIMFGAWIGAQSSPWWQRLAQLGAGSVMFGLWVPPKTWSAVVVTVADLNQHIRDNLNILKTSIDDNGHIIDPSVIAKIATYAIAATDNLIVCTANSFTVTLPTAVGRTGKKFTVKNTGAGTITMASTLSQTIDGVSAGSWTVPPGFALTFESDSANWILV